MSNRIITFADGLTSPTAPTGVDGISNWTMAQGYLINDVIVHGAQIYQCLISHTAGVFATDLAALKWTEISTGAADHTALLNIGTNTHAQIDSHIASTSNPHSVTKTQVGLSNVPNTDCTTTSNITDSINKRFVTDANLTTIGNQSGTNTGDQAISDATISTTDITTNDVSILKHGFAPKAPNDTTKFLRGDAAWAVPAGGGGGGSISWTKDSDSAPITSFLDGFKFEDFDYLSTQEIYATISVSSLYTAGNPIKLKGASFFCNTGTGKVFLKTDAALITTSTILGTYSNIRTSTNTVVTVSATPNTLNSVGDFDLTSTIGQINAVSVAAGDKIRIRIYRDNAAESGGAGSAAADARLIIDALELTIS